MSLNLPTFTKINENFQCLNCDFDVPASGSTCRDHCPNCLYSLHVDINPGDRAQNCAGLLVPQGYYKHKSKGFMILYKCKQCGEQRKTKFLEQDKILEDSFDALLKLKQLAAPILFLFFVFSIFFNSTKAYSKNPVVTYNSKQTIAQILNTKSVNAAKLLIIGDTGFGNDDQRSVATLLEKLCLSQNPDAVLMLGDNFYYSGVKSVSDIQWKTKFEDIYSAPCIKTIPFFALLGNHDYDGNWKAQIEYSKLNPQRWVMPNRYYYATFGDFLGIAVGDSNIPDMCGVPALCSLDWLKKKINEKSVFWNIAAAHHPVLSFGKYADPEKTLWWRRFMLPFLACANGVTAYFSGHDHNLQHNMGELSNSCNPNQFVVGAGGAPIYNVTPHTTKTKFSANKFGAAVLEASQKELSVAFFETTNAAEPIYTWNKVK